MTSSAVINETVYIIGVDCILQVAFENEDSQKNDQNSVTDKDGHGIPMS